MHASMPWFEGCQKASFPLACHSTLKCPSLTFWALVPDNACYSKFPGRDKIHIEDYRCEEPGGQTEEIKACSRKVPEPWYKGGQAWGAVEVNTWKDRKASQERTEKSGNQGSGRAGGKCWNKSCFFQCCVGLVVSLGRRGERSWKIWANFQKWIC